MSRGPILDVLSGPATRIRGSTGSRKKSGLAAHWLNLGAEAALQYCRCSAVKTCDPEVGSPTEGQQGGPGSSQNKEWEATASD